MGNDSDHKESVTIKLGTKIDSLNAAEVSRSVMEQLEGKGDAAVILDASDLQYISSAGLRKLLGLIKLYSDIRIAGANSDIYDILDTTGFTEMVTVDKFYQTVSVEGCEVIGEGSNGRIYKIGQDSIVKTFKGDNALEEIEQQRQVARLALILGIPTAISYDVVRVGDGYGSIYELLDAKSFSAILASEPDRFDWCVEEYAGLLRKVHSTVVPKGKLPAIKTTALKWFSRMKDALPGDCAAKLERMIGEIPEPNTMIHGDFHTKNVVLAGGEVLLIDMDTLSTGHPIFDLAQMYNAFIGFGEHDREAVREYHKADPAVMEEFWNQSLRAYLGTDDELAVKDIEDKIRCISYVRLIDWSRRHRTSGSEKDIEERKLWTEELTELVRRVDTLVWQQQTSAQ